MSTRSVVVAVCISLLSVGSAGYCYTRKAKLDSEARWLMERGNAQAVEYAERLDNSVADEQFKTFEARRSVLERAHAWQRGEMLGVMAAVLSALAAYLLYMLSRLDSQLDDAAAETPDEMLAEPVPATTKSSSALAASPNR